MPESFTGVAEGEADVEEEVEVLLVDVKGMLDVVVGFEVVVVVGLLVEVDVLLLVVVVVGLLVDVGVLTVVVISFFNVLVVVLHVGLILLFEHKEVPWRVKVDV